MSIKWSVEDKDYFKWQGRTHLPGQNTLKVMDRFSFPFYPVSHNKTLGHKIVCETEHVTDHPGEKLVQTLGQQ